MKSSRTAIVLTALLVAGPGFSGCATNQASTHQPEPDLRLEVKLSPQQSGLTGSLRGVSAVDGNVAWISGAGGSFARTWDGGNHWQPGIVAGAEELDFRDLEARDADNALLMSAGPGLLSRIYSTNDGGQNWTLQYTNPHAEGFFDGMAFSDLRNGFLYGDAVDGKLFVLKTDDGGTHWTRIDPARLPPLLDGEHGFAASGTGIAVAENQVWIATGGVQARVFHSPDRGLTWTVSKTPVVSGDAASGIFSIAVSQELEVALVGGSYQSPENAGGNLAVNRDGASWTPIQATPLLGFKSVIIFLPGSAGRWMVVSGTTGSHYSTDGGGRWKEIESVGYHAFAFGPTLDSGWAAGADGRVAKVVIGAGTGS